MYDRSRKLADNFSFHIQEGEGKGEGEKEWEGREGYRERALKSTCQGLPIKNSLTAQCDLWGEQVFNPWVTLLIETTTGSLVNGLMPI